MRCRRCGCEIDESFEKCPGCSLTISPTTGELPPAPVWEEKEAAIRVPLPRSTGRLTGSLATAAAPKTFRDKIAQPLKGAWLVVVAIGLPLCIAVAVVLVGYIINHPFFNAPRVDPKVIDETPHLQALKLVQSFPSQKQGLTVKEFAEQHAREQRSQNYNWFSAPEKNSGQFAVVFTFYANEKSETAFWLVDINKKSFKSQNQLAEALSGS